MFEPRGYQRDAIDAAIAELKRTTDPILIDAPTGAGKAILVAYLAEWLHGISSGKKVLCLAPRRELTLQNASKYKALGAPYSIFSASAGVKSTRNAVIFGTPGTVARSISRFLSGFCAVIIDEAHGITPTVRAIIDAMREANPMLRVVGLTATSYRLGSGYIYRIRADGRINGDDTCRDPFFMKQVYKIEARELIADGYLTPPLIGPINAGSYDTSNLRLQPNGKFDPHAIDQAFVGHGRETSQIVLDVMQQSRAAKGVVFFAATIQHAHEIMASLPPDMSAIITGTTKDRDRILKRFERQQIKYLVNCKVLTEGWDCTHVDVIAILMKTESVGLLQQICGRGLRLHEGKEHCLILDFGGNVSDHCPDGDLFNPTIRAGKISESAGVVEAECAACGHVNEFSRHKDAEGYTLDKEGYCLDVFGKRVETDYGPMPGHHGRRCMGMVQTGPNGAYDRCSARWTFKECPHCGDPNDISVRYCSSCKGEIVAPHEKLIIDFQAMKRDPYAVQTDEVLEMEVREGVSQKGNRTVRTDWTTPYRKMSVWFSPDAAHPRAKADWQKFAAATNDGGLKPATVSYVKEESGFFRTLAFGREADAL